MAAEAISHAPPFTRIVALQSHPSHRTPTPPSPSRRRVCSGARSYSTRCRPSSARRPSCVHARPPTHMPRTSPRLRRTCRRSAKYGCFSVPQVGAHSNPGAALVRVTGADVPVRLRCHPRRARAAGVRSHAQPRWTRYSRGGRWTPGSSRCACWGGLLDLSFGGPVGPGTGAGSAHAADVHRPRQPSSAAALPPPTVLRHRVRG